LLLEELMADQRNQCARPGCNCAVQQASAYCSDNCRDNASAVTGDAGCGCNHPDCGDRT
jgi:hypothetical protein